MSRLFDALEADGLTQGFDECEIDSAQASLDLHPTFSPYWDTRSGQDDLTVIHALGLTSNVSESNKRRAHQQAMSEARAQVEGES